MKNIVKFIVVITLLVSCSKSETRDYRFEDALGVWEGKYSNTIGGNYTGEWLVHLKSDSTAMVYNSLTDTSNASIKGRGGFTMFDNTVVVIFRWDNTSGYYISAEMTPSKDRIAGMWGIGNEDKGETYLDKR